MTVSDALKQCELFKDVAIDQIDSIADQCRRRQYHAGDTVFYEGDPGSQVYVIGSGRVKIHVTHDDGEETVYSIVTAGEFFGEMSLIDGKPRSADATCIEDAELISVSQELFFNCLEKFPELSRRVLQTQSQRLRNADRQLEMMASLDIYGRVASQLLELARLHGVHTDRGPEIRLGLTQQNLAAMVGASRESVNKALSSFRARGFIEMNRSRIALLNVDELKKRC